MLQSDLIGFLGLCRASAWGNLFLRHTLVIEGYEYRLFISVIGYPLIHVILATDM